MGKVVEFKKAVQQTFSYCNIISFNLILLFLFVKCVHMKCFCTKNILFFSYCDLLDEQDNLLMFFLRDAKIFWGEVFRRMHGLVAQYSHILSR